MCELNLRVGGAVPFYMAPFPALVALGDVLCGVVEGMNWRCSIIK